MFGMFGMHQYYSITCFFRLTSSEFSDSLERKIFKLCMDVFWGGCSPCQGYHHLQTCHHIDGNSEEAGHLAKAIRSRFERRAARVVDSTITCKEKENVNTKTKELGDWLMQHLQSFSFSPEIVCQQLPPHRWQRFSWCAPPFAWNIIHFPFFVRLIRTWGRFWCQWTRRIRLGSSGPQWRIAFVGSQSSRPQPFSRYQFFNLKKFFPTTINHRLLKGWDRNIYICALLAIPFSYPLSNIKHCFDRHPCPHPQQHLVLRVGHLDGACVDQLGGEVLHLNRNHIVQMFTKIRSE